MPENGARGALFWDRDCRDRCDILHECTGYALPDTPGVNQCATYTSAGASGDGQAGTKCHMKGIYLERG